MEKSLIASIHPSDAYHEWKNELIGKEIQWTEVEKSNRGGNWQCGIATILDSGRKILFHAITTIPINPIVDGKEGEEKRITPYGNLYRRKLRLERKKP